MLQCTALTNIPEIQALVALTTMPGGPDNPPDTGMDGHALCELGEHDAQHTQHAARLWAVHPPATHDLWLLWTGTGRRQGPDHLGPRSGAGSTASSATARRHQVQQTRRPLRNHAVLREPPRSSRRHSDHEGTSGSAEWYRGGLDRWICRAAGMGGRCRTPGARRIRSRAGLERAVRGASADRSRRSRSRSVSVVAAPAMDIRAVRCRVRRPRRARCHSAGRILAGRPGLVRRTARASAGPQALVP